MDFNEELMTREKHGRYERLEGFKLPNFFISYDPSRAEASGTYHRKLRVLFEEKRSDIVSAMTEFADLAQQARDALVAGNFAKLDETINANFDLRDRRFNVSEPNRRMVMTARSTGCTAKFAGSGGAIVGTYHDPDQYRLLVTAMANIGCSTIRPQLG